MENKDLIVVEPNEVSAQNDSFDILGNETILMLAEQAEKRIEAMNKIMNASLKMTTVNDWVLIGGIPYLQESGATKVARLFGISWQIEEPKKEIRADGHYTITYKGKFSLLEQLLKQKVQEVVLMTFSHRLERINQKSLQM